MAGKTLFKEITLEQFEEIDQNVADNIAEIDNFKEETSICLGKNF